MKKSIPKNQEQEGNEKNPFPHFGNGNQRLSFPRIPRNGNGKKNIIKKLLSKYLAKYIANIWRQKAFWPKPSQPHPPPFLIIPPLVVVTATINEKNQNKMIFVTITDTFAAKLFATNPSKLSCLFSQ